MKPECVQFFQHSKRQNSGLIWTVNFWSVAAFCGGSVLCVRPSMYHNLLNERPTLLSNEGLKCIILRFVCFWFFLSSTYTKKQLTHTYKILTKNFSLINKLMLSLEKFSELEQEESSSLLYKFSCALKLLG